MPKVANYMGLLGEFLESFYGNGRTFRTVRAKVCHERKPATKGNLSGRLTIGKEKKSSLSPDTFNVDLDFWAVLPAYVRVDTMRIKNGNSESKVEIVKDLEFLMRNPDGTIEVEKVPRTRLKQGEAYPNDFRRHFDQSLIREFFASLVLEDAGGCEIAGRECVRIRASRVPDDRIWPHWLPNEADKFEFVADLNKPSLLSIVGLSAEEVIERYDVVEIAFDEPIDLNIFDCKPLDGQLVRPREPVTQPVTIESAISKVPFKVLLPKRGIGDGMPDLQYRPERKRGAGEALTVSYLGNGSNVLWLNLRAKPDPESTERLEWKEVLVKGKRLEISDPEIEGGMIVLRFCQDGTWVEIVSNHSLEDLLETATSFEPA